MRLLFARLLILFFGLFIYNLSFANCLWGSCDTNPFMSDSPNRSESKSTEQNSTNYFENSIDGNPIIGVNFNDFNSEGIQCLVEKGVLPDTSSELIAGSDGGTISGAPGEGYAHHLFDHSRVQPNGGNSAILPEANGYRFSMTLQFTVDGSDAYREQREIISECFDSPLISRSQEGQPRVVPVRAPAPVSYGDDGIEI